MTGRRAATVEHAYQAAKATNVADESRILACPTPGEAKELVRTLQTRPDFDLFKLNVMHILLREKFLLSRDLSGWLLGIERRLLSEDNTWGDTYWGVCNGQGNNYLGKLLMLVRLEIIDAKESSGGIYAQFGN